MAAFDLPQSLSAESWNSKAAGLDKSKSAAKATLGNDLKALQNQNKAIRWALLDIDKLNSAREMDDRLKEIDAEKKSALDKLGKQLATIIKSADACNGKDIDKKAAEALKVIKADAGSQKSVMEARFNAAMTSLTQKLKAAPKPAAKTPTPAAAPGASKKAAGMAKTYRKLGLEAIMKARTKPQMKPSRFMVAEFKKSVLFYMGMKYDKAKTTEVLKAMNPNDTFVRTYVDPNSKVIWEKNALTLVSNKIPPKFATRMTKASKLVLGRGMKIRMRTETGQADEPEEAGVEEMSEAELNAELTKMAGDPEVESDEDDVSADTVDDDDDEEPAPAAKTAAKTGSAAPPLSAALVSASRKWASTRSSAKAEIDGLFAEIGKLYGTGQESQLATARKTLDSCMEALAKLDKELAALISAKDKDERTKKMARARTTADQLIEFVRSNKIMANLDKNEVREISAAAKLSSSLAEVKAALA
jgi:hypothetical protein